MQWAINGVAEISRHTEVAKHSSLHVDENKIWKKRVCVCVCVVNVR